MNVALYSCGGEEPLSEHPLGLGYLKSNLRHANVRIVKTYDELLPAQIVGLSTTAWGAQEAFEIATALALRKDFPRTIVLGGQGALWSGWEKMDDIFDHVVRGSGENAMQEIVNNFHGMSGPYILRRPIRHLDDLNFPDRGHCDKVIPCITSRGCPFGCTFCTARAHWGKPQCHSPGYVISDVVDALVRYPHATEVRFMDDLYIVPPRRFKELHRLWMSAGLHKRVVPHGFVRADLLDAELLKLLIEMGVDRIRFGVESGSPRMLDVVGKGITVEQFQQAIDLVYEAKLPCYGSFVHGLPGETAEDRRLTREFKRKNREKLLDGGTYTFRPFPGCDLYNGEDPRIFDMRVRAK